ncbi:octapeptide-repeat protein T2-like [Ambystoma mexicanum]|uniref:octapeptide-repeat protein T2-like n=1 Tax=Ambystoma mexicanum TaxID=8296 RepID=UPI0037E7CE35
MEEVRRRVREKKKEQEWSRREDERAEGKVRRTSEEKAEGNRGKGKEKGRGRKRESVAGEEGKRKLEIKRLIKERQRREEAERDIRQERERSRERRLKEVEDIMTEPKGLNDDEEEGIQRRIGILYRSRRESTSARKESSCKAGSPLRGESDLLDRVTGRQHGNAC